MNLDHARRCSLCGRLPNGLTGFGQEENGNWICGACVLEREEKYKHLEVDGER